MASIAHNVRLAAALVALVAPDARAETSVRAVTSVGAGASDNARAGVEDASMLRHSTSAFGRTDLGLALLHATPTTAHELHYTLAATGYAGSALGQTVTQDLGWESQFAWPRASLMLGGAASYGLLNDVAPVTDPPYVSFAPPSGAGGRPEPAATPDVPAALGAFSPDDTVGPEGLVSFIGGATGEALSLELSPRVYGYQSLDAQAYSPLIGSHAQTPIASFSAALGVERAFARGALRLEGDGSLEAAPARMIEDVDLPAQAGEVGRAVAGFGYELAPGWRVDGSAGAFAARSDLRDPFVVGPAARASLRFRGLHLRGGVVYDHSAMASVVLGGVFAADRVSLTTTGGFGQDERIRFVGAARWQALRALDSPIDGDTVSRWQAQAGLHVRPWTRRHFDVALSYRLTHQVGGMLGLRHMRTFERNMLLLTLTAGLPLSGGAE